MTLRAVFFDLDDTLCDTIGTRESRARRACEVLCREHTHLDLDDLLAQAMRPVDTRIVWGVPRMLADVGVTETPAGREALGIWFFEGCYDLLAPLPGVVETITRLRQSYQLGIITNGDGKLQRAKWAHLTLGIEHIVVSAECGYEKPDPRIFQRALESVDVTPDQAAFVGDRLDVDVAAAKAAGMRAVWFNHWGGSLEAADAPPDAMIGRMVDLPSIVAEW